MAHLPKDLFLFLPVAVKELNLGAEPLPGSSAAGAGFSHDAAAQPGPITCGYLPGLSFGVTLCTAESLRPINYI